MMYFELFSLIRIGYVYFCLPKLMLMKAVVYKKYGPPEVAQLTELRKPTPGNKEILIKVYASTVNRTDSGFRSAEYFVSRFWSGLFNPKYQVLGCEFAGEVEAIGKEVTSFAPEDRVFGFNDYKFGGHAEYMVAPENSALAKIPENIGYTEAAALTEGAHYALCNIRAAKITRGQNVLVYGATGAIGSAAVQLLKYFGARVTAVCNRKNVTMVQQLGADEVIDYESSDFTQTDQRFDLLLDAVGKCSFRQCKPLMKPRGMYISTELGKNGDNVFRAIFAPLLGSKKVLFPIPSISKEDIEFLGLLAAQNVFRPVIDRYYKLEDIVEAYRYVETGQKTGNVILTIREDNA